MEKQTIFKAILEKHCKINKVFLTSNELHTILDAVKEYDMKNKIFDKTLLDDYLKDEVIKYEKLLKK